MGLSLTATDDIGHDDTKSARIWPVSADRSKIAPLDAIYWKCPETGEIVIGYEDPEELDNLELVIQLDDGGNSEYVGKFNADGLFVRS